ncbi:hypothetical protein C943_03416 [Mariniradius saccharolyticus AK6]|uniref:Uncharacterized protein n=1 Tax=Mariniradius saccharolyticus AK6 TaxID=1239962 RepID=M7XIQ9_9BACT|nr:hypothetical protein C943_03416 [Mariniradius saccharolyticus AK6]
MLLVGFGFSLSLVLTPIGKIPTKHIFRNFCLLFSENPHDSRLFDREK